MYVPSQVEVIGDVQATFNGLIKNEFLFRIGIYSHLLNTVVFAMMVLALYRLLGTLPKVRGNADVGICGATLTV